MRKGRFSSLVAALCAGLSLGFLGPVDAPAQSVHLLEKGPGAAMVDVEATDCVSVGGVYVCRFPSAAYCGERDRCCRIKADDPIVLVLNDKAIPAYNSRSSTQQCKVSAGDGLPMPFVFPRSSGKSCTKKKEDRVCLARKRSSECKDLDSDNCNNALPKIQRVFDRYDAIAGDVCEPKTAELAVKESPCG